MMERDMDELEFPVKVSGELRNVVEGEESIIDLAHEVGENGETLKRIMFGKRVLQPEQPVQKEIARAQARHHEFHSIGSYCDYLKRECNPDASVVLADVSSASIRASIDEHSDVDHEFIDFRATDHPLFVPWKALIGQSLPVLKFALFVMQQRSSIVEPDGRELALTFSQIKSSKTITKKAGIGPKTLNGVMVETLIGSERHSVEIELPERVTIEAPLYLDTDPVEIRLDLLVTDTPDGIVVFVTAPELAQVQFQAFQQFVERVRRDTALLVGLGKVRERDWAIVR